MGVTVEGHLFDLEHNEDQMLLWIRDYSGNMKLVFDRFQPSIYVHGNAALIGKLTRRLQILGVLACSPEQTERLHFYSGLPVRVVCYTFSRPSFLQTIHRKLYAFFERLEIYHSDIELPTLYLLNRGWAPMIRLRLACIPDASEPQKLHLHSAVMLESPGDLDYPVAPLRILHLGLGSTHRLGFMNNTLQMEADDSQIEIPTVNSKVLIQRFNEFIEQTNPDVILSDNGDRTIFPALFRYAREQKMPLCVDRIEAKRKIITQGRSYFTYGSMIFRAPSYPLHGRWHIDRHNSFVHRESGLDGIIQLSRLSCIPVQRMARSSTGAAMTSIQTAVALRLNYLVPWQKSHSEEPRSALELLTSDKGGLIYEPDIQMSNAYENVIQIDFSQMYPTIMVHHNLSPETVLCSCCAPHYSDSDRVPEAHFPVCRRRRGIVPLSLAPILDMRRYLKYQKKHASTEEERERANQRQDALKWLLVTCFGYLGYRNAKFGRLESHEAVTAYGRQKLLQAKRISEDHSYRVLHAITDCLFLHNSERSASAEEVEDLCKKITAETSVEMSLEGIFSWIVFPSSRQNERLPVANRYFGRFRDGSMKVRGIMVRRRDTPTFLRLAQQSFLATMATAGSIRELKEMHSRVEQIYLDWLNGLNAGDIPWRDLLLRRTVSRGLDEYTVAGPSSLSLEQLLDLGIELHPGEKVRYLILAKKSKDRRKRYLTEEKATLEEREGKKPQYDREAYADSLREAFRELWEYFAPAGYFDELRHGQRLLFSRKRRS